MWSIPQDQIQFYFPQGLPQAALFISISQPSPFSVNSSYHIYNLSSSLSHFITVCFLFLTVPCEFVFILLLGSELLGGGGAETFFLVVSYAQNKYLLKIQISSVARSEEAFVDWSVPFLLSSPFSDEQEAFMVGTGAAFRRMEWGKPTKRLNPWPWLYRKAHFYTLSNTDTAAPLKQ